MSGSRFVFATDDDGTTDEDFKDLCAMEFAPENYGSPNLESAFLPLVEDDIWQGDVGAQFYLFGFPTELRLVDYELPHVHVR
ncbi:hypothetical protein [Bradyrhizobium mercantei]|uniref:hypothetical protein n=1 Tax=Bradyrhizobium mercantei TaxID=1904807 RepID=UPI001177D3CB|nr:hypothetical protein [Bradyrhizobium mercantei]